MSADDGENLFGGLIVALEEVMRGLEQQLDCLKDFTMSDFAAKMMSISA